MVNEEMHKALEACLAFEKEKAGFQGLSDCTCVNHSREADRAYENGECPHQRALAVLLKAQPPSDSPEGES